jgi:hypothetical protein
VGGTPGDMNLVQAFVWNVGTYGSMKRENLKVMDNCKRESIDVNIGAE